MPFVKGLMMIAYFAITWGVFTGINAAVLLEFGHVSPGFLSFGLAVGIGLLENLAVWKLVDRFVIRKRASRMPLQPGPQEP